ncbi:MAPEG family protein [Cellvibrio japonicus]|uniref:Putative membrane protein n=1 Tax=Cellvibrio japonicus (strain Ueda107) TaxID=498211 RepID=B3PD45_CELJU|nr:MAPEG family protein [Cellvibrio japonicus]ACE85009.1 putative membrane protein [Cellvibrio japonicus Ueda107]QEI11978.1 hypothetical protein FY117_06875 [Cellvibrio japonicus]QEI15552.1 hypothetical protein FY116_06875 [Cellvibrio japonicus]QEI19131.1 hypothetical protein FY115_06875 [Cellvibrio japonicus]
MLYPMFGMILLTLAVAGRLLFLRIRAVKSGQVRLSQFRLNQSDNVPDAIIQASRNYTNLFEIPVLFYAAGCIAVAKNQESLALVILGWLFVLIRAWHSWIHLTHNNVITRMRAFLASNLCVLAIWIILLINHIQQA